MNMTEREEALEWLVKQLAAEQWLEEIRSPDEAEARDTLAAAVEVDQTSPRARPRTIAPVSS